MHSFASSSSNADEIKEEREEKPAVQEALSVGSLLTDTAGTAAWFNPTTVADVRQLLQTYANTQPTRLTVGNTAMGVAK
jgi:hypothetical protein